jgi:hypothetical protein
MRRICGIVTVALAVQVAVGCGSDTGLNLAGVRGSVKYKGQPVKNGTIVFEPDPSKNTQGPTAMSTIDADGNYVLATSSGGDGAIVGFHKVGITGLESEPVAAGADQPPPSPEKDSLGYLKGKAKAAQQSNKRSAVKGDTFTDRAGRSFRYVTPKKLSDPADSGITLEVRSGSNRFDFDLKEDGLVDINK